MGDQVEIVDQPRHGRIIAVGLARLQRDAFTKTARADTGGVERLHHLKRRLGLGQRNPQRIGNVAQRCGQVARIVELADDLRRDGGEAGVGSRRADLAEQVLNQRFGRPAALVDAGAVFAAGHAKIAAPVGNRLAIHPAVAGVAVAVESAGFDIERRILAGAAFTDQLVGGRAFEAGAAWLDNFGTVGRKLDRRAVGDLEQRIGFQRLADEGLDFEIGQRQQLDCLLQLRRHHQRLGLPQVKAGTEGQFPP